MSNMTLFQGLASSAGLSQEAYLSTIKATVFPQRGNNATNEQLAAFLMVAKQYNLNPLTKEIFAFPANGGIQPVVSIDGWMKLINSHPEFDGMGFEDKLDESGNPIAVTCRIHRKDRAHAIEATEYLAECKRETDVWKKWPRRMLRHKAAIQAARYAFGFAGIVDPDEAERGVAVATVVEEVPAELLAEAEKAATGGKDAFRAYWKGLNDDQRKALSPNLDALKEAAANAEADAEVVGV